ncbi:MAG: hypothetical protein Q9218_003063 [Villophora microphyllina]
MSLVSDEKDSQLRIIHVIEDEEMDEDGNMVRDQSVDGSDAVMEDLNYIMFGDMEEIDTTDGIEIATIHWSKTTPAYKSRLQNISEAQAGPRFSLGKIPDGKLNELVLKCKADSWDKSMRLITLQVESAYHSSIGRAGDMLSFGTHYNLRENRNPEIRSGTVHLHYQWQSLKFLYNIRTGRATYLLACSDQDFEYYAEALADWNMPHARQPHPFCIHLILLFKSVFAWNKELEDALGKLLYLENRSIFRPSKVTFESADETKRRLQELHRLFKDVLIRSNTNKRHIEMITCLTRDLDRILKTVQLTEGAFPIDEHDHQRIVDGFHCLKDFCLDRERRLTSRAQRVQNLIALVGLHQWYRLGLTRHYQTYNLLANRDSIISHSIAHETRQDGAAMKTIAFVTMLFFPATFVSSFLGTNLVALDTGPDGRTRFVFSDLWWIYLVSAVPLTMLTLVSWWYWITRRSRRAKKKDRNAGETEV